MPQQISRLLRFWNILLEAQPVTGNIWDNQVATASGRVDGIALLKAAIYSDIARQKVEKVLTTVLVDGATPSNVQLSVLVVAIHRSAALNKPWADELLPMAKVLGCRLLSHIQECFTTGEGRKLLSQELPAGALTAYLYRSGRRCTHEDPRAVLARNITAPTKATKAKPSFVHAKHNILYLAKNAEAVAAGMEQFRTLNVVLDEARFPNCQVLQSFCSAPMSSDVAAGVCLPPQIMPAISISIKQKKVDARIVNAQSKRLLRRRVGAKPKADKGVPTWHSIVALDNALKSWLAEGLRRWHCLAGGPVRLRKGCGGRYELVDGRWRAVYTTAKGEEIKVWLLPGSWVKIVVGVFLAVVVAVVVVVVVVAVVIVVVVVGVLVMEVLVVVVVAAKVMVVVAVVVVVVIVVVIVVVVAVVVVVVGVLVMEVPVVVVVAAKVVVVVVVAVAVAVAVVIGAKI